MKYWVIPALVALLAGCAGPAMKPETAPASLSGISPTAPLGCRFEKRVADGKTEQRSNLYFWRQAARTETRDDLSKQGEIWEQDSAGHLFYTRLFFPERVALEYSPGDLAATGTTVSWEQLEALVDPSAFGKTLKLEGTASFAGLAAERYAGTLGGVATEIDWLPTLKLPSRILKKPQETAMQWSMAECAEASRFSVQPISPQELAGFRQLDFSDLGDMESDPMVQRILELTGGHHHHEGH